MAPAGMGAARPRGEPAHARRFPDSAAGMEALDAHEHARKLPRDIDPDTIDDPDVRDAFMAQLNDDEAKREPSPRAQRDTSSPGSGPLRAARAFSVPDSVGSVLAGGLAFALLLNYVRGGPGQVKTWFSAKLTNGRGRLA